MLTKENELSSIGPESESQVVTGSTDEKIAEEKDVMEEPSNAPSKSSPKKRDSTFPTAEEFLLIFQEDLRNMKKAGIEFVIVPDLKPLGYSAVVFKNAKYDAGDFKFVTGNGGD